jgi:hypothetical protein
MRLSEAIRLGAMLKPQGYGLLVGADGSCALGAAADACGQLDEVRRTYGFSKAYEFLNEAFPVLSATEDCPGKPHLRGRVTSIIVYLNDHQRWTREAIADWIETIEAQSERAVESPVTVAAVDPVAAS